MHVLTVRSAWTHPIRIGGEREQNLIKRINTGQDRKRKTGRMIRIRRETE
jgi:hypothetical protein